MKRKQQQKQKPKPRSILERSVTTPATTARKVKLQLVSPEEDIPRLIRGLGKLGGGREVAIALRTDGDGRGVLVLYTAGYQTADVWRDDRGKAPVKRYEAVPAIEAAQLVKRLSQDLPDPGSVTVRSMWTGILTFQDENPALDLRRKIASYGTLIVQNLSSGKWSWRVQRAGRWYGREVEQSGEALTLREAIEKGYDRAMGILGEACSMRDTQRRAAHDPAYAETHPIKKSRERKDPLGMFNPKPPKEKAPKPPKQPKAPKEKPPKPPKEPKQPKPPKAPKEKPPKGQRGRAPKEADFMTFDDLEGDDAGIDPATESTLTKMILDKVSQRIDAMGLGG